MTDDTIFFMMCCNNTNDGVATGRANCFEFGKLIRIEGDSIVCKHIDEAHIKLNRRTFPIISYRRQVGNWCWDSAQVTIETANEIANYLQLLNKFDATGTKTDLYYDWMNNDHIDFAKG